MRPPCQLFFFLFILLYDLFGISYFNPRIVVTILFKVNYRKYLTVRQLIVLVGTQFLMALLKLFAFPSICACTLHSSNPDRSLSCWFFSDLAVLICWDILRMPCALSFSATASRVGWTGHADGGAGLRSGGSDHHTVLVFASE